MVKYNVVYNFSGVYHMCSDSTVFSRIYHFVYIGRKNAVWFVCFAVKQCEGVDNTINCWWMNVVYISLVE